MQSPAFFQKPATYILMMQLKLAALISRLGRKETPTEM